MCVYKFLLLSVRENSSSFPICKKEGEGERNVPAKQRCLPNSCMELNRFRNLWASISLSLGEIILPVSLWWWDSNEIMERKHFVNCKVLCIQTFWKARNYYYQVERPRSYKRGNTERGIWWWREDHTTVVWGIDISWMATICPTHLHTWSYSVFTTTLKCRYYCHPKFCR